MTSTAMSIAIEAVWERSREEIARRIATLEHAVSAMLADELAEELRMRAERDAHKLAGSLGMFGFANGSELARELEQALSAADGPAVRDLPRLAELTGALRAEFDGRTADRCAGAHADAPPHEGIALLVVGSDRALAARLSAAAPARDLRVRRAATAADARRLAALEAPDAVVLDVSFSEEEGAGDDLALLDDLSRRARPVPVVVLTGSGALVDRVELARRGGCGFISRERPPQQVIDAVDEAIARRDRSHAKVLALDDDPAISAALQVLLAARGLAVSTINEPLDLWDALEEVRPDLLILDLDMPGLNGIDLCRAVRADSRFGQLPVVFLTARRDRAAVQRIFEAGADDYIGKPIVEPELVTRVLNRLERVTLLRQLAERDGLTGIPDRRASTTALDDLIAMSDRFGEPLSLAVLDLDSFKALNDRLGHAAGDSALQRLATLLSDSFRGEDVIGRWGGDEFVVGMYGMSRANGVQRLTDVLERLRLEELAGRGGARMHVSFTAGIAEYPADAGDLHELYQVADETLYVAKAAGRNRVFAASMKPAERDPAGLRPPSTR